MKEMILVANYILQGLSLEQVKTKVIQENPFQVDSVETRKDLLKVIFSRLNSAPKELLEWLAEGPSELSRYSNLYLILMKSRLLREMLTELILDKLLIFQNQVSRQDIRRFFERKAEQDELISNWSEDTFNRSQNYLIKTLMDAGLLVQQTKETWLIQPIFLPSVLKDFIHSQGHGGIIKMMLDRSD